MSDVNDGSGQGTKPDTERTVTICGLPLLIAGVAVFLSFRWMRRRFERSGDSAS